MRQVTATELKAAWGGVLHGLSSEAVEVVRYGRRVAVVLDPREYERLTQAANGHHEEPAGERHESPVMAPQPSTPPRTSLPDVPAQEAPLPRIEAPVASIDVTPPTRKRSDEDEEDEDVETAAPLPCVVLDEVPKPRAIGELLQRSIAPTSSASPSTASLLGMIRNAESRSAPNHAAGESAVFVKGQRVPPAMVKRARENADTVLSFYGASKRTGVVHQDMLQELRELKRAWPLLADKQREEIERCIEEAATLVSSGRSSLRASPAPTSAPTSTISAPAQSSHLEEDLSQAELDSLAPF